jgi:hypothetical protein
VDDPSTWEIKARCRLRFADVTAAKWPAGFQQPWTGGAMYRTIYSPTPQKSLVGGVDYGIDALLDDVAKYNFKLHSVTNSGTAIESFNRRVLTTLERAPVKERLSLTAAPVSRA